jgi:hypothetical protein
MPIGMSDALLLAAGCEAVMIRFLSIQKIEE